MHFGSEYADFECFLVISDLLGADLLKELQRDSQNRRYRSDELFFSTKLSSIMTINHSVARLRPEMAISSV